MGTITGAKIAANTITASRILMAADPEIALVTVPSVELLEVGEDWATSTGIFTFTDEDLVSAVSSQDDPAIRTPVIKLGHIDPRFDGQPSLGRILNMRVTNNDQTLIGDLVGIPAWLASVMASAYPRRSVEGQYDVTTRTGNTWTFALTAVALLGAAYPAVDTLEDIQALWGSTPPTLVPAEEITEVIASDENRLVAIRMSDMPQWKTRVAASEESGDSPPEIGGSPPEGAEPRGGHRSVGIRAAVSVEDIRRTYYETLGPGQYWWWIREVRIDPAELIVDDDEGALFRVPYFISGDTATFGEPTQVKIEYVEVAAGQKVAASWGDRVAAGRPERPSAEGSVQPAPNAATMSPREEVPDVKLTEKALKALGLEPGADEDKINAALEAMTTEEQPPGETPPAETPPGETQPTTEPPAEPNGDGEGDGGDGEGETPPQSPQQIAASIPEGMTLVDKATLEEVMAGAKAGATLMERHVQSERNALLDGAIRAGKFPKSRRPHYEAMLKADPEGTKTLIDQLAPGLIPVVEMGTQGGESDVDVNASAYPKGWETSIKATNRAGRGRVRVMGD